ncbi:unnamed protein product [Somion occarium]|uniref:F-box domain-containing protein n=1 Tax=Somion occarium TaxID=3059160 RepID=A0ABP1D8M0_9APHY
MGQYWDLVNTDRHEGVHGGKLGEIIRNNEFSWVWSLLVRPVGYKPMEAPRYYDSCGNCRTPKLISQRHTLGLLQNVPDEILLTIFELADTADQMVCLGLTNVYLFYLAYDCVQHRRMIEQARWAGQRLTCIGDYSHLEDTAAGVFSEEEKGHIMKTLAGPPDMDDSLYYYFTDDLRRPVPPWIRHFGVSFDYNYELMSLLTQIVSMPK